MIIEALPMSRSFRFLKNMFIPDFPKTKFSPWENVFGSLWQIRGSSTPFVNSSSAKSTLSFPFPRAYPSPLSFGVPKSVFIDSSSFFFPR